MTYKRRGLGLLNRHARSSEDSGEQQLLRENYIQSEFYTQPIHPWRPPFWQTETRTSLAPFLQSSYRMNPTKTRDYIKTRHGIQKTGFEVKVIPRMAVKGCFSRHTQQARRVRKYRMQNAAGASQRDSSSDQEITTAAESHTEFKEQHAKCLLPNQSLGWLV